jgi:hypothetical protein
LKNQSNKNIYIGSSKNKFQEKGRERKRRRRRRRRRKE